MPDKKPTSSADASLHGFLERTRAWEDPSAVYIFDGERGAPRSEICREDLTVGQQAGQGKLKECVVLEMYPTQLFEAMQKYGFYCALPSDPTRTHMVCRRLPQK